VLIIGHSILDFDSSIFNRCAFSALLDGYFRDSQNVVINFLDKQLCDMGCRI